jgi:hypothetical protein
MIKTTLGQLMAANQEKALAKVAEAIPPGGYHFCVAKLLDAVYKEIAGFNKQNQALVRKYGVVREDASISMVGASGENIEAFNDGIRELLELEVQIPYEPIVWAKLGEEAQKKLSVGDVQVLGPLLIET